MLDHVGLNVRDYQASRRFYEQALEPLGYEVVMAFDEWKAAGFGRDGKPSFWVSEREPLGTGTHVAFQAADRAAVDAFHAAALAAGGRDNGAPGVREHYHPTYYGAFVLDPDRWLGTSRRRAARSTDQRPSQLGMAGDVLKLNSRWRTAPPRCSGGGELSTT